MTAEVVAEAPTDPWSGALSALMAIIEKPGCSCHYVDIGVGYQKVAESSDCPQCTPFGLAELLLGEMHKRGFVHESEFVQAIDFDDTLIWQQSDRHLIYTDPEYDGVDLKGLVPLYRRVTEPTGSVTP